MQIKSFFEEDKEQGNLPTEGEHAATVVGVSEKVSKAGADMIVFDLDIDGYALKNYCINTPGKNWGLKKMIHALLGEAPPSGSVSFDSDNMIGRTVVVKIVHDNFNDKLTAKVKGIVLPK